MTAVRAGKPGLPVLTLAIVVLVVPYWALLGLPLMAE
jgi:hypothetical protein